MKDTEKIEYVALLFNGGSKKISPYKIYIP